MDLTLLCSFKPICIAFGGAPSCQFFFFLLGSLAPQELGKEPKDDPNIRIINQGIKHGLIKLMKTTIEHTPSTSFWVSPRLGGVESPWYGI
jgi:hypothetical protein